MEEKNNGLAIPDEMVMTKIYMIRGKKVMLDRDLTDLYGVETRVLNQAVRRNEKPAFRVHPGKRGPSDSR